MVNPFEAMQANTRSLFNIKTASTTFLILEYLETLSSEIEFLWPDKWNLLKILYTINRYGTLTGTLFGLLFEGGSTNASFSLCRAGIYLQGLVITLVLAWSETILFMRVYALSRQNRYVGAFLVLFWLGIFSGLMTTFGRVVSVLEFLDRPLPGHACLPAVLPDKIGRLLPFILVLFEQIVVMAMCIYFRLNVFLSSRNRLARTFARDGLYYFFAISLMSVANVAFSLAFLEKFDHYLGPPQAVIQSALASRLVLHLRKAKVEGESSVSQSGNTQQHNVAIQLRVVGRGRTSESWRDA